MQPDYFDVIRRRLAIPAVEGPDKVTTLEEAVRRSTAPGRRVTTVVSDAGVYEKTDEHGELVLTGVYADRPEADAVTAARAACGWELKVASTVRRFEAPAPDELRLVRLFDPRRYFLG